MTTADGSREARHELPSTPPMTTRPAFGQLWAEECDALLQLARGVRDGGVIIDIGTAQGGSASLFHQATRGRGVAIHTFDPQPSAEAFAHLAGTGVVITRATSAEGARQWQGTPVDLLFIDGSHHLADVTGDFNAWAPYLASGAMVAFHDYDPEERGGLIHLGVQVAVDALLARGLLTHTVHTGRLLSGAAGRGGIAAADCVGAARALTTRVASLIDGTHAGAVALGRPGPIADVVFSVLDSSGMTRAETPDAVHGGAHVIVFERPLGDTLNRLRARPSFTGRVELLDNLGLAWLVEHGLRTRRDALLALATDRRAFFKWEEVLDTLTHATSAAPDLARRVAALPDDATIDAVSRFVALEQVRLVCLSRIVHAVTGYEL